MLCECWCNWRHYVEYLTEVSFRAPGKADILYLWLCFGICYCVSLSVVVLLDLLLCFPFCCGVLSVFLFVVFYNLSCFFVVFFYLLLCFHICQCALLFVVVSSL